jgi:Zn-dependent protease with chaperone function
LVNAFRAAVSVVMLAGFYVLALLQLGAAIALTAWSMTVGSGMVALKVVLLPIFVIAVVVVSVALGKIFRTGSGPPRGVPIGPAEAPYLWQTVRELAQEIGTRAPDEVVIVAAARAGVVDRSALLGMIGGRRMLHLGLPLLQVLSVDQLRAVLAHELGHYPGRRNRLGETVFRGWLAVVDLIPRIGPRNPLGWIFRPYARLYLTVAGAVVRSQAGEADRAAVRLAGRTAAGSALLRLPVLGAAWDFYMRSHVEPGWRAGYTSDDLFGGFRQMVEVRQEGLDELHQPAVGGSAVGYDLHPPWADRLAAMDRAPEDAGMADRRPASSMLPHLADLGHQLHTQLTDMKNRIVLPWPQLTAARLTADLQREVDAIGEQVARTTGASGVNLATVLDLVGAGRAAEIAQPFFPDATGEQAAELFAGPLEVLLRLAAVRSGVAGVRHSWTRPPEFATFDGESLVLTEVAELAVSPTTLYEARRRLANMGINVQAAGQPVTEPAMR